MQKSDPQPNTVFEMILDNERDGAAAVPTEKNRVDTVGWESAEPEGQLAIDVAQDEKDIIIVSTLAGAMPDQLEVYVHNDLLTIRGARYNPLEPQEYFYHECFWGKFSRSIVLPVDVKGDLAHAEYKNGVLIVRIPKVQSHKKIQVTIVEE